MLNPVCITVPGLNGSGPDHWQSWVEKEIPGCRRVTGIDYDKPVIAAWADVIRKNIRDEAGSVILIAHSFGCLASTVAIADNETKVAGVILVAPASPQRFSTTGLVLDDAVAEATLMGCLPASPLGVPGVVIASTDDPWMKITHAQYWADAWGFRFTWLRNAGHINAESGFGRWPLLTLLVHKLRQHWSFVPLGSLDNENQTSKQKFTSLSRVRQLTRKSLDRV